MAGKKIELVFTLSDETTQTVEFTVPLSRYDPKPPVTGDGLTGQGTESAPLALALTSADASVTITAKDGKVDLAAKGGSSGGFNGIELESTALQGNGTEAQPLKLVLSEREGNLLSQEGGLLALMAEITADGRIIATQQDNGSVYIELAEDAYTFGKGLTGTGTEESPVKLNLVSDDSSVTITEKADGSVSLKAAGGGNTASLVTGSGITGTGAQDTPLKLAVTSVDKSITFTEDESGNVDLAVNSELQSLMPAIRPDLKPQHLEPGTFKTLLDAYKEDRSKITQPWQKSFTASVEDISITPHITMLPAVNGKYLYADGPIEYEPDVVQVIGCYYISYDTSQPLTTLWERETRIISDNDVSEATKTLERASKSGVLQIGVPDTPTADDACGPLGSGVYFKTKIALDFADTGKNNVVPAVSLTQIPCRSDGTPIPYNIDIEAPKRVTGSYPTVAFWVTLQERPTHKIDLTTKEIKALTRAPNVESGLPDYPETDSSTAQNIVLNYTLSYHFLQTS